MAINDRPTWNLVAESFAPQERITPSEWAAKYRLLKEGTTPKPGPWSNDYWPWQRPIMDAVVEYPDKMGALLQKHAQGGGSELFINVIGWCVCNVTGNILYLITTDDQAREFSVDRFTYMIDSAPVLARKFLAGREHHELMQVKRFATGKLALFGSQSPNKLMSEPYRIVLLDEMNRLPRFPRIGSAWKLAHLRTRSYTGGRAFIFGWSTPTTEQGEITVQIEEVSTQQRFFILCPHCEEWDWLQWNHVEIKDRRPSTARYICNCGKEITDGERAGAVFEAEYRSILKPEVARERPFAGFYISRMYDPYTPLSDIALQFTSCVSESDLQVFYNGEMGEPYTPSSIAVTPGDIERRSQREPKQPAPEDTRFITAGVDVQAGFWMFVDISAWTPDGNKHLLRYEKVQGWEALKTLLRGFRIQAGKRELGVRLAGIDAGFETTQVYHFCRNIGETFLLPCWYGKPVGQGEFWKPAKIHTFPGGIEAYYLKRDYWMERALNRFAAGDDAPGVVLLKPMTEEYQRHILAPARVEDVDKWGNRVVDYIKDKRAHDDFLQCAAYAEFAAVRVGLDQQEEEGKELKARRAKQYKKALEEHKKKRGDHISRRYRGDRGSWMRRKK